MKPFTDLDAAAAFHGHLGPNLIIGMKMGNHAIAELQPESCFKLQTEVHCPARPPVSCVIDGIQLSTGCTMGKKSIDHIVSDGPVKVIVTNTATGNSVAMQVVDGFIEKAGGWMKEIGEVEASQRTWAADDARVFTVVK
jgi:formylmethanofuran dehydrogenase subunit E